MDVQFGTEEELFSLNAISIEMDSETVDSPTDGIRSFNPSQEVAFAVKITYISPKGMKLVLGKRLKWHQQLRMHISNIANAVRQNKV